MGYRSILEGQLSHSLNLGSLILTTPRTLWFYLSSWVSQPILLLALIGLLLALSARDKTLLFVATACGLLATTTLFYLSFARLILPVIPGICLLSGYALVSICRRVSRSGATALLSFGIAIVLIWKLLQIQPVVSLDTDAYRRAAAYLKEFREPLITQLKKNYYFYEQSQSLEIRWQNLDELDALIGRSGSVVVAVDPIIHKLAEGHSWIEKYRSRLRPLRSFEDFRSRIVEILLLSSSLLGTGSHVADTSSRSRLCRTWLRHTGSSLVRGTVGCSCFPVLLTPHCLLFN